jgi:hypothetical protein
MLAEHATLLATLQMLTDPRRTLEPISFAEMHGFTSDPFASTNSEDEELLEDYFVPPPYFPSVFGDPQTPKPRVIFAPRGGGKTAQRRMIEIRCMDKDLPFVCLTYDHFDGASTPGLSLNDHLAALCRLLTVTILEYLDREPKRAFDLSDHEKRIVKVAAETFASGLSLSEYNTAFTAVKSLGDRATAFWHKYGGIIAAGITVAMKKAGLDDISIPAQLRNQAQNFDASARYFYEELVEIIIGPLRGGSIYILVDKVDETAATNGRPAAAWALIENLIQDLPTVEKKGVAFKFFLWDQLRSSFRAAGARADRIQPAVLEGWDVPQLQTMLTRRLQAYSNKKVGSFNDLLDHPRSIDAHLLLCHLAKGSPREMIRMAESIADEHTRISGEKHLITSVELMSGIRAYSALRLEELAGSELPDLQAIGRLSFNKKHVRNIFNISKESAQTRIDKWREMGLIVDLGKLDSVNTSKPMRWFGPSDARLAIALSDQRVTDELFTRHILLCKSCGSMSISDFETVRCRRCGSMITESDSESLADAVRLS